MDALGWFRRAEPHRHDKQQSLTLSGAPSRTASPIEALPKSNAQTMEPRGRVVTDWRLRRRCAVLTAQLWHIQDLLRDRLINEKWPVDKSEIEVVVA
jgi:hypothetical protein